MRLALQTLNDLEREGLIRRHAIGDAMSATFYLEPVSTFDLKEILARHGLGEAWRRFQSRYLDER